MSTRKIKNARDLESNELIYFKSHAQATFMSDGSTVEDVINEIKETGGVDLTDYVTTTQLNTSLSEKQDTISDLADIRSGASKGATAVQPASIATAVTINGVNKTISSNKINIGTIPTAVTINNSTKTGSTIALGTVVTGVTMNGSAKTVSNGKVDLGTIITAHQTLKTINGESIVGSGDIEISGGGDYLPLTGGTIAGDLTLTGGTGGMGNFGAYSVSSNEFYSDIYYLNRNGDYGVTMGNNKVEIINSLEQTKAAIDWSGDGTKFLSDNGTYKTISSGGSGGSSDANVQAVETGDVIDDVNVDYATSAYVNGLVGDINSVLDNIIDGSGSNNSQKYILWTEDDLQFGGENNIAQPNVKYICTTPITQIVFGDISGEEWHGGITEPYSEYTFIFECNNTSIETSTSILWANGSQPILENGVRYELSISLMYINNEYIGHAVLVPFKTI